MSQELPILDTEHVHAEFDMETGISHITYRGVLNSEVTGQLYKWVGELIQVIGPDATHAVIFDFREVTQFAQDNLRTARRESRKINKKEDAVNHPVALIVGNMYQEQMVRVSNRLAPNEERKQVVNSLDEALQFINEWHAAHNPSNNASNAESEEASAD